MTKKHNLKCKEAFNNAKSTTSNLTKLSYKDDNTKLKLATNAIRSVIHQIIDPKIRPIFLR